MPTLVWPVIERVVRRGAVQHVTGVEPSFRSILEIVDIRVLQGNMIV